MKVRVNDLTLGDAGQVILAGSSMQGPCPYSVFARAAWVKVSRSGHPAGSGNTAKCLGSIMGRGLSSVIQTGKQTALGGTTHTADAGGADFLLIRSVP